MCSARLGVRFKGPAFTAFVSFRCTCVSGEALNLFFLFDIRSFLQTKLPLLKLLGCAFNPVNKAFYSLYERSYIYYTYSRFILVSNAHLYMNT